MSSFIMQDIDILEKEATPKLEAEKEARLGLEVEKDAKQNLEDASPNLEAGSDPKVYKSLRRIKGCEDVEADKSAGEGRLQKVG